MPQHPDPAAGTDACPDQLITLNRQLVADCAVVIIAGEVDMVTTPYLRDYLQQQLEQAVPVLVVDLRGVRFLGSSGLAVLVEVLGWTRERGITLRLVCNSREVLRPLEATGLTELFEVHPDLDTALPPA
jgi:anti-sigma B factor antagonist